MSLRSPIHMLLLIVANALCVLAVLLIVGATGCMASPKPERHKHVAPSGTSYYVSADGSDSASGRSPGRAWRTVTHASRADLQAGDTVLFEGGQTFGGDTLMPEHSGRAGAPIVYGSYGHGRARLPKGIWFKGLHDVTFRSLAIDGAEQGISGKGDAITIERSRITNTSIGIHAQVGSSDWLIRRNVVKGTGDSGLIIEGDGDRIERNSIVDTGRDRSIDYGKHGIYLKASHTRVSRNVIRNFSGDGISTRHRSANITSNRIRGGGIGIAWFQGDERGGFSRWSGNRISSVKDAGLYVSPSDAAGATKERFVIRGNVVRTSSTFMDFQVSRSHTQVQCNLLIRSGRPKQRVCSAAAAAKLR